MTARHPATTLVAAGLALGAAAVSAVLVWHPWESRDQFGYADLEPIRDSLWQAVVVDAVAYAVVAVAFSIVVCLLARTRGAVWATVGAALSTLGGIAFAMGEFAFAALSWHVTDPEVLTAQQGGRLLDQVVDHPEHGMVVQMAGFLLLTLGAIALCTALLRARAVPVWLPVGIIVCMLAQFAPFPSRVLDFVQVVPMALLVVLAWLFVRSDVPTASSHRATDPARV